MNIISLVLFLCLVKLGDAVSNENCASRCAAMQAFQARFPFSQTYLNELYNACIHKCFNSGHPGSIYKPGTKQPTQPPVVWTPRPTQPPVALTPRPTQPPVVWTPRPTQPPVVWTPRPTQPPVVWTSRPTQPPVVWTHRPTQTPVVWTPRPTQPPVVWTPRPTQTPIMPTNPSQFGCGYSRRFSSRIIGGTDAGQCEYPWLVVIKVPKNFCGGSIIDSRHILTAAHCVKGLFFNTLLPASSVLIKLGSSRQSKLVTYKAKRVFAHPKHNFFRDYDVAIIALEEELQFGPCVAPICLPPTGVRAETMDQCEVAGWGITNTLIKYRIQPDYLQKVTLPIVTDAQCVRAYGNRYFNNLKLCAGFYTTGGKDSCKGDSGGPLMCLNKNGPYYAFGIVSFGKDCARPFMPGVYTKVNHPFILKFIQDSIAQSPN